MSLNTVALVGRITKDPELRTTGSGKSVVNFTLAVNRIFGDKDQADFIRVVAWQHSAEFVGNYVTKGDLLAIEGRIQTDSYEDTETGKMVYTTDIIANSIQALESRAEKSERQEPAQTTYKAREEALNKPRKVAAVKEEPILDIDSDDLPF